MQTSREMQFFVQLLQELIFITPPPCKDLQILTFELPNIIYPSPVSNFLILLHNDKGTNNHLPT